MAQDYDVVLKLLFRSQSSQAVREIAGGPVKRWLDKELPAIRNTRADGTEIADAGKTLRCQQPRCVETNEPQRTRRRLGEHDGIIGSGRVLISLLAF